MERAHEQETTQEAATTAHVTHDGECDAWALPTHTIDNTRWTDRRRATVTMREDDAR